MMTQSPAEGERAALRGYRWQYDHIAELVYDALYERDFEALRLTDPDAGRVDDLVLSRRGRTDAYQFKSGGSGYVTFRDIVRDLTTKGGNKAPSLTRSLADGWTQLRDQNPGLRVHLVTEQPPSIRDNPIGSDAHQKPSPKHFSAFVRQVLEPLGLGSIEIADVPRAWKPALDRLRTAAGLEPGHFAQFLQSLSLDLGAGIDLPRPPSERRSDILQLSGALQRRVSEASDVVRLDRRGVLDLVGWTERTRLHSVHEFPVNLDTYAPLDGAIEELAAAIGAHNRGYIAVTGSPGSGKSTLLSQVLSGTRDHVVRYYAHVPGPGPARTRLTARSFLHDLVLMLHQKGFDSYERQLTSGDVTELRRQLFEQLATASKEYEADGRRTIVIVDGLDHVRRDYRGDDALLAELPTPDQLGDGILVLVGSRTLDPLRPQAQEQVRERRSWVDLSEHRLSAGTVVDICRRAPVTADLDPEIHKRIADLSAGHPLALSYLLNRFETQGEPSEDILASAPRYSGNVAEEYSALWAEIEDDDDVIDLLAVCSRLRVGFTSEWLSSWVPERASRAFHRKLRYLFRQHHDGWRFFHDSFRQFAADHTALGDTGPGDTDADVRVHRRVADLCADADNISMAAEQLYHRYGARDGDAVLNLAQQAAFREQYRRLRSPSLIHDDLALSLEIAAERADVVAILRLLLALTEVNERTFALESINLPALLFEAGLVNEAIAYCSGSGRSASLAQAYELATILGAANEPAGRRLFDEIEHLGLDDPVGVPTVGEENDVAVAWTRAAAFFRPISKVVDVISSLVHLPIDEDSDGRQESDQFWLPGDSWQRYSQMMRVVAEECAGRADSAALQLIDAEVAGMLREGGGDGRIRTAALMDIRVGTATALLTHAKDPEAARVRLDELVDSLRGVPLIPSTLLQVAELLERHQRPSDAVDVLARLPYGEALTARELSDLRDDDLLDQRFRYWRLRHLLGAHATDILERTVPSEETHPRRGGRSSRAELEDHEASEMAAAIDGVVQDLARLDAALLLDDTPATSDAWDVITSPLALFPVSGIRDNPHIGMIHRQKPELMRLAVDRAVRAGEGIPELLSEALQNRFEAEPRRWPLPLRLDLADRLQTGDTATPWYDDTLRLQEELARSGGVYSRLDTFSDLVQRYARAGRLQEEQRLVTDIVQGAFGVGGRKDYQFDAWVAWLGQALSEIDGHQLVGEAAWLARLLVGVERVPEGSRSDAPAELAALVVPADAMAAVRVFEYLVRHATAPHLDALARLVTALITHADVDDFALAIATDLTTEMLAPAANHAYPNLASALVATGARIGGSKSATELGESVARRTDISALPTTRSSWRNGLGLPHDGHDRARPENVEPSDDYGALELSSGERIARATVASRIATVDDIMKLRRAEAEGSHFHWSPVAAEHAATSADVLELEQAFADDPRRHCEVLATLAEAAEQAGDRSLALRLAGLAIAGAPGDAWVYYGGARRRAAAVTIRLGGFDDRVAACQDLARQMTSSPWFPRTLILDSVEVATALDPSLDARRVWPEIRTYLEGIAESVDLGDPDVLMDHGCRWWLLPTTEDRRAASDDSTVSAALAELAVGHLSHPTWLFRDSATTVIVRALRGGSEKVAEALARFVQPGASDDTIERVGRCLATARDQVGYEEFEVLKPVERMLASHRSKVIRDLAVTGSSIYRPLGPAYDITLPEAMEFSIGSEGVFPHPHGHQYHTLANGLRLDLGTVLAVGANYASESLGTLPEQEEIQRALSASGTGHAHPLEEVAASRAGFGRVLGDFADAGMLDDAPPDVRRLLRTFDVGLVGRAPSGRPRQMPNPPTAGHEQTVDLWLAGIEDRLDEYLAASNLDERVVIGARVRCTVLNWGHLEEHLVCGTTMGTNPVAERDSLLIQRALYLRDLCEPTSAVQNPEPTMPLVLQNDGLTFHQIHAEWLAFRPDVAAALGWVPDPALPGRWYTARGDVAVETIWWADGWWGRSDPAFNDTEAQGYAVTLTSTGLSAVSMLLGDATRHFFLNRSGTEHGGVPVEPIHASRSVPIAPS